MLCVADNPIQANDAIDLSNHLFDQLGAESAGRIPGVEWFFD
jgi:hypothetical protein